MKQDFSECTPKSDRESGGWVHSRFCSRKDSDWGGGTLGESSFLVSFYFLVFDFLNMCDEIYIIEKKLGGIAWFCTKASNIENYIRARALVYDRAYGKAGK